MEDILPAADALDDLMDLNRDENPLVSLQSRLKLVILCCALIARRNSPRHWASASLAAVREAGVQAGDVLLEHS